jgi:hypothetical protein
MSTATLTSGFTLEAAFGTPAVVDPTIVYATVREAMLAARPAIVGAMPLCVEIIDHDRGDRYPVANRCVIAGINILSGKPVGREKRRSAAN